ncbi:MAG: nitrile hydratase subunit alpha [Chloroflexota bacterium]|nr:nitrile hydratase subunit alpha [Chloroflexota bacterium]
MNEQEIPHDHAGLEIDSEAGYYAARSKAIESLLVDKGIITALEVDREVNILDSKSPADGAKIVARAWLDNTFRAKLLTDASEALAEIGYDLPDKTPYLKVVENTEEVHYVVVCTLCSCYPRMLLGRPPDWYKSLSYRSRVVVDPRSVIGEFGLHLSPDIEVRVLDSTADMRYMVIPKRPKGTDGMTEELLASLVTRDSMIGVSAAVSPVS